MEEEALTLVKTVLVVLVTCVCLGIIGLFVSETSRNSAREQCFNDAALAEAAQQPAVAAVIRLGRCEVKR